MFLRRIGKLSNLGLFFDARQNFEVGQAALIYGPNGYGKSTLTAMFRSLGANDPAILAEKNTIHRAGNVGCELLCADGPTGSLESVKFDGRTWNAARLPTVVVFDAKYVAENIYSDFSVTHEHKKNISAIILGSEGVRIAGEIAGLNKALGDVKAAVREAENIVASAIPKGVRSPVCALADFVAIPETETSLLSEKEGLQLKLANLERTDKIQNLQQPKELAQREFAKHIDTLDGLLAGTMPGLSPDVTARMQERLAQHADAGMRNWLQQGVSYLEKHGDSCPFCLRGKDGAGELFADYEAFFSRAYRDFAASTAKGCLEVISALEDSFDAVGSFEDVIAANRGKVSDLRDYLAKEVAEGHETDVEHAAERVGEALVQVLAVRDTVLKECEMKASQKTEAPLTPLQVVRDGFSGLADACAVLSVAVDAYNTEIEKAAEAVTALKLQRYDISEKEAIAAKLGRIALVDARFSGPIREAVSRYRAAEQERTRLEMAIAEAEAKLNEHNKGTTEKYLGRVNELLKRFGARYSVEPPKDFQKRGHAPVLELTYKLFDTPVPSSKFGIFSDSEKRLLAFCFFLAQLEGLPDSDKAIVVIDDPFSSFDDNNMNKLVHTIGGLADKAAQVIVLSHYSRPLVSFIESTQVGWSQMEIVYDPTAGSCIQPCDIKKRFGDLHAAKMDELEHFRTAAIPAEKVSSIMQDIRIAIEHELKVRYRKYLKDAVSAGTSTLGSLIDELEKHIKEGSVTKISTPTITELRRLNGLTSRDHHADPDSASLACTPEEVRLTIDDAMKLIYEAL